MLFEWKKQKQKNLRPSNRTQNKTTKLPMKDMGFSASLSSSRNERVFLNFERISSGYRESSLFLPLGDSRAGGSFLSTGGFDPSKLEESVGYRS
jgi:hypothetical protein